ncbi:hypothetical protein cypCar_00041501, partial [Cyprinus carpio]
LTRTAPFHRHGLFITGCDLNNRSELVFFLWPVARLNSSVTLEGGGGAQICTQQDGIYIAHVRCDEMMMKMMMAQGEKDPKHTSQVVLVKRIIMKHDNPVQQGIGKPSVYHAVVVIFLEFFAWGLLTTPMLMVLHETFPKHTF